MKKWIFLPMMYHRKAGRLFDGRIKGKSYKARLADKANGKACAECSILNRSIAVRKPDV
ncbi:hypothetical protein [Ornithinibacillus scapharcae]|uniref:hypothetical protein n=1 Tax=Ornithinibacillus scapharcae TaxID=1147159 RepID=UPI000225BFE2|nr:hypothetical protein [Ornithinibacillus scapharcae]